MSSGLGIDKALIERTVDAAFASFGAEIQASFTAADVAKAKAEAIAAGAANPFGNKTHSGPLPKLVGPRSPASAVSTTVQVGGVDMASPVSGAKLSTQDKVKGLAVRQVTHTSVGVVGAVGATVGGGTNALETAGLNKALKGQQVTF